MYEDGRPVALGRTVRVEKLGIIKEAPMYVALKIVNSFDGRCVVIRREYSGPQFLKRRF